MTFEVVDPTLKRKIKLTIRIENAQGLMLSTMADTVSNGKNHWPCWETCQTQALEPEYFPRVKARPKNNNSKPTMVIKYLFIPFRNNDRFNKTFIYKQCIRHYFAVN